MGKNFTGIINGGIIIRWGLIQLFLAGLVILIQPPLWLAIGVMLLGEALATYMVVEYIQKHRVVKIKFDDEHPIDPTLQIANETLPYLRRGLNEETAYKTAEIILKISDVSAVAVTDREKVLAFIGECSDHHKAGNCDYYLCHKTGCGDG